MPPLFWVWAGEVVVSVDFRLNMQTNSTDIWLCTLDINFFIVCWDRAALLILPWNPNVFHPMHSEYKKKKIFTKNCQKLKLSCGTGNIHNIQIRNSTSNKKGYHRPSPFIQLFPHIQNIRPLNKYCPWKVHSCVDYVIHAFEFTRTQKIGSEIECCSRLIPIFNITSHDTHFQFMQIEYVFFP